MVGGLVSRWALGRWSIVLVKPVFSYRMKKLINLKKLENLKNFQRRIYFITEDT